MHAATRRPQARSLRQRRGNDRAACEAVVADGGDTADVHRTGQPLGEGLRFILHLLRTADDILRESPPLVEFDGLCLSRWIGSRISKYIT